MTNVATDLQNELIWRVPIYWDPVPPDLFKVIPEVQQREITAALITAHSATLRAHADAAAKLADVLHTAVSGGLNLSAAALNEQLQWKPRIPIWWDPAPPEWWTMLHAADQKKVSAIKMAAHAAMLQAHAEATAKVASILAKASAPTGNVAGTAAKT